MSAKVVCWLQENAPILNSDIEHAETYPVDLKSWDELE